MNFLWKREGDVIYSEAPQHSPEWYALRPGRLTMSNLGTYLGHSSFQTREQYLFNLEHNIPTQINPAMQHGTDTETSARDWYIRNTQLSVTEVGIAIPAWNYRIGASVDGLVESDGCLEIKCPMKMYRPLDSYLQKKSKGWIPPTNYREHIWTTHYDQMQGCMGITGRSWCDYLVYCTPEQRLFLERVPFDPIYWKNEILPAFESFPHLPGRIDPELC